jgi:hypothetical protein
MISRVEMPKGSIHTVAVTVTDRLGNLTDLDASTKTYDIASPDSEDSDIIFSGEATNVTGTLTGLIQVDTTNDDLAAGEYWLFFTFTTDTDTPRLGPIILVIT